MDFGRGGGLVECCRLGLKERGKRKVENRNEVCKEERDRLIYPLLLAM